MDWVKGSFGYRFFGTVDDFTYADDKFRPTWKSRRGYRLTVEHRHQLCVHLAAHAVIGHMSGACVYMLAVAPRGVRSWAIAERKTREIGPIWGICSTSDLYCTHMQWDEDRQTYAVDRAGWEAQIEREHASMAKCHRKPKQDRELVPVDSLIAARRHEIRAHVCGFLAGHIADGITVGMTAGEALRLYDRRDTQYVGGVSDIVIAEGLAGLLQPGEYENAVHVTEEVLRRPKVWKSVNRLARALEKFGLLEGSECEVDMYDLMPKALPDWPPAPDSVIASPTP
jgi:hypothetical protein